MTTKTSLKMRLKYSEQHERELELQKMIVNNYILTFMTPSIAADIERLDKFLSNADLFACDVVETFHQEWRIANGL